MIDEAKTKDHKRERILESIRYRARDPRLTKEELSLLRRMHEECRQTDTYAQPGDTISDYTDKVFDALDHASRVVLHLDDVKESSLLSSSSPFRIFVDEAREDQNGQH